VGLLLSHISYLLAKLLNAICNVAYSASFTKTRFQEGIKSHNKCKKRSLSISAARRGQPGFFIKKNQPGLMQLSSFSSSSQINIFIDVEYGWW
jgi:hypothetical protein